MTLEDVVRVYNSAKHTNWVLVRVTEPVSKLVKGMRERSIRIIDYDDGNQIVKAKATVIDGNIEKIDNELELSILYFLFTDGRADISNIQ